MKGKILVVDDDQDIVTMLRDRLESLGFDTVSAPDGARALELIELESPNLVLLDLEMPRLSGLDVLKRLAQARQTDPSVHDLPVIVMTAHGTIAKAVEAMKEGAQDFITKPFDVELLNARLCVAARILGLQEEVRQLTGLLPICSYCKMMRDDGNEWVTLERYIMRRTDASFTHGICPDCYETVVRPQLETLSPGERKAG